MKSLYESILTSTGSGKNFEAQKVVEWFKSTQDYVRQLAIYNTQIKAELTKNGKWIIDIIGEPEDNIFIKQIWGYNLEKADTKNASGVLPYKIHSITKNGEPMNVNYHALKFKDSSEFVEEVRDFKSLWGCEIDTINSLPKNCEEIYFSYKHMIGGGHATSVKTLKNITVDKFSQDEFSRSGGLSLNLKNIKNLTVKDKMCICDEMLGYFSLDRGGRKFKKDASDMLTEFFKNNHVDPKKCVFIASRNNDCTKFKSGTIWYDKKEELWHFKGEQQ